MADNPFYRFFRHVKLPIRFDEWRRMPRLSSFKNEYWDGHARYTPRPNTCDCYLDLNTWPGPPVDEENRLTRQRLVTIRPLRDDDWPGVPKAFHGAFAQQPPLWQWNQVPAARAARCIIEWTRQGRDGTLVGPACHVATADYDLGDKGLRHSLVGAALVVLIPAWRFRDPPMADAVPHPENADERVLAHLDWIFVSQFEKRNGIATLLLDAAVRSLRDLGHRTLASTCLLGDGPSMCWHWRNGFQNPSTGWSSRGHRRASDADTATI